MHIFHLLDFLFNRKKNVVSSFHISKLSLNQIVKSFLFIYLFLSLNIFHISHFSIYPTNNFILGKLRNWSLSFTSYFSLIPNLSIVSI